MAGPLTDFIQHHFRHFNAAALKAADDDYIRHLDRGGVMFVTIAGAMSVRKSAVMLRIGDGQNTAYERTLSHGAS